MPSQIDKTAKSISDHGVASDEQPLLSILCLTFNHEPYIEECLESILAQKWPHSVEVVVHDDASTDGTQNVLRAYQEKYPELIRLVLQDKNQFLQGNVVLSFGINECRGDFVALCHGDDYWLSPFKLQHQYHALRGSMCGVVGNPSITLDQSTGEYMGTTGKSYTEATRLDFRNVVRFGGNVAPYSSIMVNSAVKRLIQSNVPPVRSHTGLQLLASMEGGMLVLPTILSIYRVNVPGSGTNLMLSSHDRVLKTAALKIPSLKRLRELSPREQRFGIDRLLASNVLAVPRYFFHELNQQNLRQTLDDLDSSAKARILVALFFEFSVITWKALVHRIRKQTSRFRFPK